MLTDYRCAFQSAITCISVLYLLIMALELSFATWNAIGIMSSASYISSFLEQKHLHILGISEHWLFNSNLHFLDSISSEYVGFCTTDSDLVWPSNRKVGKGGVAVLWHMSLSKNISPLDIESDRICGVQYTLRKDVCLYFIQVYAPSSNHSNNIYRDFIDLLQAVISMYSENGTVIIMGDFNAHLQGQTFIKATDERGRYLLDMLSYHNLVAVDTLPICTGATASFVSYGDAHVSLIDHILVPDVKLDTILSCEITDDHVLNVSRHRPVICVILVSGNNSESSNVCTSFHIKWKKIDEPVLRLYRSRLDSVLIDTDCSDASDTHTRIEHRYKNIVAAIKTVSDEVLPKSNFRHYLKPYWDRDLKDLHAMMRKMRRDWISAGRPRGNNYDSYRKYKDAKRSFRSLHRKCAEKYLTELNTEIDNAAELDSAFFWKKINGRRKYLTANAGSEIEFNGRICRDPAQIATGWGEYFQKLCSDTERTHYDSLFRHQVDLQVDDIINELTSCHDRDSASFSVSEIKQAVKLLKTKKACGNDGVYNEHLINGGNILFQRLYTDMYVNGYVPDVLKQGLIITLHKGGRK